jgi:hypothetical protein
MNIETGVTERLRKIIGEKGLKQKYVAVSLCAKNGEESGKTSRNK